MAINYIDRYIKSIDYTPSDLTASSCCKAKAPNKENPMTTSFSFLFFALTFSANAFAGMFAPKTTLCTATYGEGYSWLQVEITDTEFCLRCDLNHPQHRITATLSVPYGPRGTYISQNYAHAGTQPSRPMESLFEKVGSPFGPTTGVWNHWFPKDVVIYSGSKQSLFMNFRGESLTLYCTYSE